MSLTAGEELELIYEGLKAWVKAEPKGPPEVKGLVTALMNQAGFAQSLQKRWEREREVHLRSPRVIRKLTPMELEERRAQTQ